MAGFVLSAVSLGVGYYCHCRARTAEATADALDSVPGLTVAETLARLHRQSVAVAQGSAALRAGHRHGDTASYDSDAHEDTKLATALAAAAAASL